MRWPWQRRSRISDEELDRRRFELGVEIIKAIQAHYTPERAEQILFKIMNRDLEMQGLIVPPADRDDEGRKPHA